MVWQQWVYLGWILFSIFVMIMAIGKPRDPLTPAVAAISVSINLIMLALVISIGYF